MINQNRPTIGYLLEKNIDGYEFNCWSGIVSAARALDVNLICFSGGRVSAASGPVIQRSKLFDLVTAKNVDGLIISSGPLGNDINRTELMEFLKRYNPLPMVSIGVPIDDMPCVTVDNSKGMYDLVMHMIEAHGYKKVAFIKGPSENTEAMIRFDAYKQALKQCDIELDENLILEGNFTRDSGRNAIVQLLDIRKVKPDAIIGANDFMALYAMKELQRRGIKTPEEVAVAGFDDLDEAVYEFPSLTTVHQPLFELGYQSVTTLLNVLNNHKVPAEVMLPTRQVIRNSCGCYLPFAFSVELGIEAKEPKDKHFEKGKEESKILLELKNSIAKEIAIINQVFNNPSWLEELVKSFLKALKKQEKKTFLLTLSRIIPSSLGNGIEIQIWQKVISSLFDSSIPAIGSRLNLNYFYNLQKKALIYLGNLGEHYQRYIRINEREIFNVLSRISDATIDSFNKEDLKNLFLRELPIFGIESCYIAVYSDRRNCKKSTLYCYFDKNNPVLDDRIEYPSEELIPGGFNHKAERFQFLTIPLVFKGTSLGFVLLDIGIINGTLFEAVADQLSRSLIREEMVAQIQEYSTQLEEKVEERTFKLEQAQKKIVSIAHQAGKAEIAASTLHNVGNVLNSIMISSNEVRELVNHSPHESFIKANNLLREHIHNFHEFVKHNPDGKKLLEFYLALEEGFCSTFDAIQENIQRLSSKADSIKDIITSQSKMAGDISLVKNVNLKDIIEGALETVSDLYYRGQIKVIKTYGPISEISVQKSKLFHILVNLFKNSYHALCMVDKNNRSLKINVGSDKVKVWIEVIDSGIGITKTNLNKLFHQGFTTKRTGQGLGLHSSAIYMEEMGGKVTAKSRGKNQGTTITLEFPLTGDDK